MLILILNINNIIIVFIINYYNNIYYYKYYYYIIIIIGQTKNYVPYKTWLIQLYFSQTLTIIGLWIVYKIAK